MKTNEMEIEFTGDTVRDAVNHLRNAYPKAEPYLEQLQIAVNEEYCKPDRQLKEGDTLAFIPPVSGG